MKAATQKSITIRTAEVSDTLRKVTAALRDDNFGGAYSHLFDAIAELSKIEFEIVKELGAIAERTK